LIFKSANINSSDIKADASIPAKIETHTVFPIILYIHSIPNPNIAEVSGNVTSRARYLLILFFILDICLGEKMYVDLSNSTEKAVSRKRR